MKSIFLKLSIGFFGAVSYMMPSIALGNQDESHLHCSCDIKPWMDCRHFKGKQEYTIPPSAQKSLPTPVSDPAHKDSTSLPLHASVEEVDDIATVEKVAGLKIGINF